MEYEIGEKLMSWNRKKFNEVELGVVVLCVGRVLF